MAQSDMATMMDLPRELYLIICSNLDVGDLARLASVSRSHYMAVQQPLFSRHIRIKSCKALEKLANALEKGPVMSRAESHPCDRDIPSLDLTLLSIREHRGGEKISPSFLADYIGAISRQCSSVQITLTIERLPLGVFLAFSDFMFPSVTTLTLFFQHPDDTDRGDSWRPLKASPSMKKWVLDISGTTFPNLRSLYTNALSGIASEAPKNLRDTLGLVYPRSVSGSRGITPESPALHYAQPFCELSSLQNVKIESNHYFDCRALNSLISSNTYPGRLTRLEIVLCPLLHPIRDLADLALFLRHGLDTLQFLRLHLAAHDDGHAGFEEAYRAKIGSHPEHHLCDILRERGQRLQCIDLSLAFACKHAFLPAIDHSNSIPVGSPLPPPPFSWAPNKTLPERAMAAGYRYRRLMFHSFCTAHAPELSDVADLAHAQGEDMCWELLFHGMNGPLCAWLVSGCAPVTMAFEDILFQPFDEPAEDDLDAPVDEGGFIQRAREFPRNTGQSLLRQLARSYME